MNQLIPVLTKTIVGQFYRQNAGLLAVVFFFAGSFLRSIEHIALAQIASHSLFILGLYIAIWIVYAFHATRFAIRMIRQYDVLYQLRLIPVTTRLISLYVTQLQLLIPVLAYAGFVLAISIQENTTQNSILLIISVILISIIPLSWIEYVLRHPNPEPALGKLTATVSHRFTTPYGLFFLRYLVQRQLVLLLLTKAGTVVVVLGVLLLYPTDDYDIRLLGLGVLVATSGHAALLYQLYQFEHERLAIYRNLPVSTLQRLLRYAFLAACIFLPEGILLLRYTPAELSAIDIVSVWMFGHSLLLLQLAILLKHHRPLDRFLPVIYWLIISGFFLIMYQFPLWGLAMAIWGISGWLIIKHYWQSAWEIQ